MDVDTGIKRKLPPLPDEENVPSQVDFHKKNILIFDCSPNSEMILLKLEPMRWETVTILPGDLKNEIITFLTNYGRNPDLSESPLKLFYQLEFIKKHNMKLMLKYKIKLV